MNFREGFRRIYVIGAVGLCLSVVVHMLPSMPTKFDLSMDFRDLIARADAGIPVDDQSLRFDAFHYLMDHYGGDPAAALATICRHDRDSLQLTMACAKYNAAADKLGSKQRHALAQGAGVLALLAGTLYVLWRILDWVFAGFSSSARKERQ